MDGELDGFELCKHFIHIVHNSAIESAIPTYLTCLSTQNFVIGINFISVVTDLNRQCDVHLQYYPRWFFGNEIL